MRFNLFSWGLSLCLGLSCLAPAWSQVAKGRVVEFADPELPEEVSSEEVAYGAAFDEETHPATRRTPEVQLVADEQYDDGSAVENPREIRTTRSIYKRSPGTPHSHAEARIPAAPSDYYNDNEIGSSGSRVARKETLARGDLDYHEGMYADDGFYADDGSCSDGSCGGGCGGGCGVGMMGGLGMRQGGPWFADLDYLQWWTQGMDVPPLVVRVNGNAADVIFGNQPMLTDERSGYRIKAGKWFDDCQTVGIQGEYLRLGDIEQNYIAASNALGRPQLGRPFIEANSGQQFIQDVSVPLELAGSVSVNARGNFSSAGLRMLYNTCNMDLGCGSFRRIDFLLGYRYLQLDESLLIHEDLTSIRPAPNQGQFAIDDRFQTFNDFNGGEFGWNFQRGIGRWRIDGTAKLAIGATHERVTIFGQTTTSGANDPADNGTRPGGLLAQQTNIGTYTRNEFALIPELAANLGYQITPNLRFHVGYTFIYWSRVARPGDHVDLTVNRNLIPDRSFPLQNPAFTGPARPAFEWQSTDFWAQGINVGLHLEY